MSSIWTSDSSVIRRRRHKKPPFFSYIAASAPCVRRSRSKRSVAFSLSQRSVQDKPWHLTFSLSERTVVTCLPPPHSLLLLLRGGGGGTHTLSFLSPLSPLSSFLPGAKPSCHSQSRRHPSAAKARRRRGGGGEEEGSEEEGRK